MNCNRFFLTALLFLVISAAAGFSAASSEQKSEAEPALRNQATGILESILEGIAFGDYNQYTRNFSKSMKDTNSRENLLQIQSTFQKKLGKLQSLEYLGHYAQYGNLHTLFKARFRKEKDDVLIKLILDKNESDRKVNGFWLESPSLQ